MLSYRWHERKGARKALAEAWMVGLTGCQKPQISVTGVSDLADGIVLSCKISCRVASKV